MKLLNTKRNTILGGIALSVMLALPMGCVGTDPGDEAQSETMDDLSSSFLMTCTGSVNEVDLDTASMRFYIHDATATSCKRNSGPPNTNFQHFVGRCFNDLSNRNGVLTCANG
jgi:hypothetical protein